MERNFAWDAEAKDGCFTFLLSSAKDSKHRDAVLVRKENKDEGQEDCFMLGSLSQRGGSAVKAEKTTRILIVGIDHCIRNGY